MPSDDAEPTQLPDHELLLFVMTQRQALDLAMAGHVGDGYRALSASLERASELHRSGEPWTEELLERHRHALADFKRRWEL